MRGHLRSKAFCGLVREESSLSLIHGAKPFAELPKKIVRRLSDLERGVASCLLGLDERVDGGLGDTQIVYASRYGAMGNTLNLLKLISTNETLSPTAFSLSVHNAAIGVASQITQNKGGHTAIAAGIATIKEALTECLARIKDGADQVVLIYTDCRLTEEYAQFDESRADVQFAVLLEDAPIESTSNFDVKGEFSDGLNVLRALEAGCEGLTWFI